MVNFQTCVVEKAECLQDDARELTKDKAVDCQLLKPSFTRRGRCIKPSRKDDFVNLEVIDREIEKGRRGTRKNERGKQIKKEVYRTTNLNNSKNKETEERDEDEEKKGEEYSEEKKEERKDINNG